MGSIPNPPSIFISETFEENAFIKAKVIAKMTGKLCIADDSGLCMEAFNGFPGIRTLQI